MSSLPPLSPPESLPVAGVTAYVGGLAAGCRSGMILVTVGTFVGVGALAHDLGFTLTWAVVTAVVIWAAPAQVVLMTALAGGAPLIGIAVAVALSAVRLLPMVVSLIPLMRSARTRTRDLILPAHFISVTLWVEGFRLLPSVARDNRVAFLNGVGTTFGIVAVLCTIAGFQLAAGLPLVLAAALLMLTPLAFLMSTAAGARLLSDRLALVLGLIVGPLLAWSEMQLDLLWAGVVGGTLAYATQRAREAMR
ncbi:MAG TPA: AzlC family ABC transporter permease [Xanthobacteraceae bacterium]|nr:AzlC family ABC transporter permease [Xanthobacteraceae bacterium]